MKNNSEIIHSKPFRIVTCYILGIQNDMSLPFVNIIKLTNILSGEDNIMTSGGVFKL